MNLWVVPRSRRTKKRLGTAGAKFFIRMCRRGKIKRGCVVRLCRKVRSLMSGKNIRRRRSREKLDPAQTFPKKVHLNSLSASVNICEQKICAFWGDLTKKRCVSHSSRERPIYFKKRLCFTETCCLGIIRFVALFTSSVRNDHDRSLPVEYNLPSWVLHHRFLWLRTRNFGFC